MPKDMFCMPMPIENIKLCKVQILVSGSEQKREEKTPQEEVDHCLGERSVENFQKANKGCDVSRLNTFNFMKINSKKW